MVTWANHALLLFMGVFAILIIVDLIIDRSIKRFIISLSILLLVFLVLNVTTGFPTPKVSFGGVSPIFTISIMFICILLGIAAQYVHSMRKFSWRSFLKPFVISPIVLLPMLGTVQGARSIESVQLISLALLAFQNGYFWKVVLDRTEKQLQNSKRAVKGSG